jgi:hypothetical protein
MIDNFPEFDDERCGDRIPIHRSSLSEIVAGLLQQIQLLGEAVAVGFLPGERRALACRASVQAQLRTPLRRPHARYPLLA